MNKVILMGRLTKDPEMRYTNTNNIPVCSFSLAVDRRFSRQNEEKQTDFFLSLHGTKMRNFALNIFKRARR